MIKKSASAGPLVRLKTPDILTYRWKSSNWSGYCRYAEPGRNYRPFSSVYGEWVVPAVTGNPGSKVAIWVGIDGGDNAFGKPVTNYLIQTGTGANVLNGAPTHHFAWWEEILPDQPFFPTGHVFDTGQVELDTFSYPVLPGDLIGAMVVLTDSTYPPEVHYGTVSITNKTRN